MNDLISRKALLAEYDRVHIGEPGRARKLIEDAPRVDAEPVRHGQWKYRPGGWYCTACNKRAMVDAVGFAKYCCRCGAKMDGGAE